MAGKNFFYKVIMGKIRDISNQKFGRLLVLRFSHKDKHHKAHWYCKCTCGNEKIIAGQSLIRGYSKSCGCIHTEVLKSDYMKSKVSEYNKKSNRWVGSNNPGYNKIGITNVSNSPEVRKKISISKMGDKNPSKRLDVRLKISKVKRDILLGEKAWNWKGGISKEIDKLRNTFEYSEWRKAVYKKDNFTCQKCNKSKSGKLIPHHIESVNNNIDLIVDLNNGITLCEDCHTMFHRSFGYGNNNREQLNIFLKEN